MMQGWAPFSLESIVSILGAVGTIAGIIFAPRPRVKDVERTLIGKIENRFLRWAVAFCIVYKIPIFVVLGTIVVLLGIQFANWIKVIPPQPDRTPTPPPTISITPSAPPVSTPSSTIDSSLNQTSISLIDLAPLRTNKDAFFFHNWDEFNTIQVGNNINDSSIGVKIPQSDQEYYYKYFNKQNKSHDEFIEYSLEKKYKTLRFDYGIDNSSYPRDRSCASQCRFGILVQKCSSEKDLFEPEDQLFYIDDLNYYKTVASTGDIDVSGAEAIRITVHWRFDVIQTKPLAFNIAIINPTLYLA